MPWFCVDADPRGGASRGLSSTAVALAAYSIAAQRAENDAAGAAKAQQMAISTAGLQLALLLDAIQPGALLWPAYTTSTDTNTTDVSPNFEHDQFEVVSGFVQIMGASKTTSIDSFFCPAADIPMFNQLDSLFATEETVSQLHASIMDRHGFCPFDAEFARALSLCTPSKVCALAMSTCHVSEFLIGNSKIGRPPHESGVTRPPFTAHAYAGLAARHRL